MQTDVLLNRWARAWPVLGARGTLKAVPEDFVVIEQASHAEEQPEQAAGNHLYLLLQKRNQTTRELVRALADANGVPLSSIGYAGMKDKHAVTTQWLSIPVSSEGTGTLDVAVPEGIVEIARVQQAKKLRRGWHTGNRFDILLRDLQYAQFGLDSESSREAVEVRLRQIGSAGVPNYFGEQRFGSDNLSQALAWLPRRRRERNAFRRGLHLSVLRSFLFNEVLSARVAAGNWNALLDGETAAQGPLWGRGRVQAADAVIEFEREALADHMLIAGELEFAGLNQERRALQLIPRDLTWEFQSSDSLRLQFSLPPGTYATSVLRELGQFERLPVAAADSAPDSARHRHEDRHEDSTEEYLA